MPSSPSRTTGSASIPSSTRRSSSFSDVSTPGKSSKGPVRAWPSATRSSRPTAAGSGWRASPVRAPPSSSDCAARRYRPARRNPRLCPRSPRLSRMSTTTSELHIMLIEDSRADVTIIERALREGAVPHRLTVIPDGRRALDYLFGLLDEDAEPDREPDLILLDLNLPGIDGHQVLSRIKADPQLRSLPVVVLTTSHR